MKKPLEFLHSDPKCSCNNVPLSSCFCPQIAQPPQPLASLPQHGQSSRCTPALAPCTHPVTLILLPRALLACLLPRAASRSLPWVFLICRPQCVSRGPLSASFCSLSQYRASPLLLRPLMPSTNGPLPRKLPDGSLSWSPEPSRRSPTDVSASTAGTALPLPCPSPALAHFVVSKAFATSHCPLPGQAELPEGLRAPVPSPPAWPLHIPLPGPGMPAPTAPSSPAHPPQSSLTNSCLADIPFKIAFCRKVEFFK